MVCDIKDRDCEDFPFAAPLPLSPFIPLSGLADSAPALDPCKLPL
jgi:hypothetical protein